MDQAPRPIDRIQAESRIRQAALRLGLTFAECMAFVRFDPDCQTASWAPGTSPGEEEIRIGPALAELNIQCIEMALRHELLHRSLYNGFGEAFDNPVIRNLALDVCINRLLCEAYPEAMRHLCSHVYAAEAKQTAYALCDCTADPQALSPDLARIWRQVFQQTIGDTYTPINPASLYFQLTQLVVDPLPADAVHGLSCAHHANAGANSPAGAAKKAMQHVSDDLASRLPNSSMRNELERYSTTPSTQSLRKVEEFIKNIRLLRIVDRAVSEMKDLLEPRTSPMPYPLLPSRLGIVYQLAGISKAFHLYWNQVRPDEAVRSSLGVYVDVSRSMREFFPLVSAFAHKFREFPLAFRTFDTEVRPAELNALAHGDITSGGGTDFDAPVLDFLEDTSLKGALLFTDGESPVSRSLGHRLKQSGRPLFVVFVCASGPRRKTSLDQYATRTMEIHAEIVNA